MNSEIKSRLMNYRMSLCSALLLAAATLAGAQLSAQAQDHQVPFRATFSTEGEAVEAWPLLHITIQGVGQALHMGRTTVLTTDQVLNLITLHATATYTLTAANGDTLVMSVYLDYTVSATGFIAVGEFTVIEGTGRFLDATGGGTATLVAEFPEEPPTLGVLTFEGSISKARRH